MKSVFIFGAGASKQSGAPLMCDFLERAEDLYRTNRIVGPQETALAFYDVFNAMSELRGIYAKAYLDLDNIETLFGAIEMAQIIGKFAGRNKEDIKRLRESIVSLIVHTLESTVKFPVSKNHIQPPLPYNDFVEMISALKRTYGNLTLQTFSFITFNYDLALDYALQYYGSVGMNYCLPESANPPSYPYLKLHGSINWGFCQECKKVIPVLFDEVPVGFLDPETSYVHYRLASEFSTKKHCGQLIGGPPVIVPPTWNKTGYHNDLAMVWRKASEELASAENIFVIGYSLPQTDLFFRYLFALGTESVTRIKRFWVFNPDQRIESNFRDLISRSIESKFKFISGEDGKFENSIKIIRTELEKA